MPGPIVVEDTPRQSDIDELKDALNAFNYDATDHRDGRQLAVFLRDHAGRMIAGLSGFTWGGYCRIEYLWIAAPHRRTGLGRALVAAAEAEARRRGCDVVVLDTHDFQAPGFYERLGYVAVGRAEGVPRGSAQTWFRKALA